MISHLSKKVCMLFMIISGLFPLSCTPAVITNPTHAFHLEREAFIVVAIIAEYTYICSPDSKLEECKSQKDMPAVHTKKLELRGSGILIDHVQNGTYAITAGHVCKPGLGDVEGLINKPPIGQNIKIKLYDFWGKSHVAHVIHTDDENDLCLLHTDGVWGETIRLAPAMPNRGEKVYNLAAPFGIFSPKMVLIFDGYYSGRDTLNNEFFTIPTRPGSSGSPILNSQGHLISITHSASIGMESIALGCTLESLRDMLQQYLPGQKANRLEVTGPGG